MSRTPATTTIQRAFLGWDGPALPSVAKVLADEYEGREGVDMRKVLLVTPGARAGRRLAELLLDQAEGRGLPFTPPQLATIGHFPEKLYEPTGPMASATASATTRPRR
jgi:hypothetical protein